MTDQPKESWERIVMLIIGIVAIVFMIAFVYIAVNVVGRTAQ